MNAVTGDMDNTIVKSSGFVSVYSQLRQREKRSYSNEELRKLPHLNRTSLHYAEWKLRAQSTRRLLSYLEMKQKPLDILEVGCGNGWLSNKLASIPGCRVTGIDPHHPEILQAREVFGKNRKLEFIESDLLDVSDPSKTDVIIFAASLQYFGDLNHALKHCFSLLKTSGEIHILDTPFYAAGEIQLAAHRSASHFKEVNVPEMKEHYHHHSWKELESFQPDILYSQNKLLSRIGFKLNPFPWIRIKK